MFEELSYKPDNAPSAFAPQGYNPDTIKAWAGDSQWRACQADWARFRKGGFSAWGSEGFWALALHRLHKAARKQHPEWVWAPVLLALCIVRKLLVIITLIDIHPDAEIGPGLIIPHGGPIRVHGATKIGADCALHHMCTIGAGPRPGAATIGDHVFIGCHSSIIGQVTIGDSAMIAANSLVISNVPAGFTAIGVPAKMLPQMSPRW
jgi:serine O-acetyltransferase